MREIIIIGNYSKNMTAKAFLKEKLNKHFLTHVREDGST